MLGGRIFADTDGTVMGMDNLGGTRFELSSSNVSFIFTNSGSSLTVDNGEVIINGGGLTASGLKAFDIAHPVRSGKWRLRHRALEAPEALLMYRYVMSCTTAGPNLQELPHYWSAMNARPQIFCSAVAGFGNAYGTVDGNMLQAYVSLDGDYNVMVIGTRNDRDAQEDWNRYTDEYEKSGP